MDEKLTYWGSVILSALALALMIANISLSNTNRAVQMDVSARQASLNNAQALSQLNQGLTQAMAQAAYKNNNQQLRDLLTSQGITVNPTPAAAPAKSAAAPDKKKAGE